MRYDYVSIGFYTFDCLGWPFETVPEGGGTTFIKDLTLTVSGAAGTAVIAAAKMGLKCLAVGGYGRDLMGDWAVQRIASFGVDVSGLQRFDDVPTSSSIVLTRADGSRPALHLRGATAAFRAPDAEFDRIADARVVHFGGVGLMDAMDGAPNAALIRRARERGATTTVDVFVASPADMPDVEAVLPAAEWFIPSVEEAQALSGLTGLRETAEFFLARGARRCVLTLGGDGAYYRDAEGLEFVEPAFDVEVVCTCGCGDAFNAGLATGLVNDMDPREAVRFAQATSALNATGLGSQAGVRDFAHTLAFMRERPTRASAARI